MTQAARTRPAPIPDAANEDAREAGYAHAGTDQGEPARGEPAEAPHYDLIELLFFAYRDFVADPDRILAEYGFGRAHHRVLHFVDRHPGLTIAELLDILRITKQSLNRVLKELIEQGYIAQRTGTSDRRHRLLTCTPEGRALAQRLAGVQGERVRRALAEAGPALRDPASRFLLAMIEPGERAGVSRLIAGGDPARGDPAPEATP
ncbi:MarR family winged helix-turn-helix transcriptional regulator [Methylobacterium platani]|uniref:MarR family winged helix-turn-helix transcriptional regulator n=1 Tax=Methylobacterium platani TaxID=427683 RepID=UPI000A50AFB5|nr:MarR family transcriptional regulator [Methylobacterium platani]